MCQALRTRIGQGSAYVPKLGVPVQIQGGDRYGQPRSWLWGRGRAWCTLMEIPGSSPRMTPERNIRRQVYLLLMRMWLAQATALSIELMPDVPARLRHDNRGRCRDVASDTTLHAAHDIGTRPLIALARA